MAGPDVELDDSEWIDSDSDSDDPNPDSDLFANPARFCSMLKIAAVKPMYKQFIALLVDLMSYATHKHKDSAEQRQAIWPLVENGAVDIILDFLSRKDLYRKERWNRRIRTLFSLAIQNAVLLPGRLHNIDDIPSKTVTSLITRWRVKAEKMYTLMWQHRHFVYCMTSGTDRDEPDFGALEDENGIPVLILHFAVIRHDVGVFLPHSAVQIILYLWALCDHLKTSQSCMTIIEMFMMRQAASQAHKELGSVFGALLSDIEDARTVVNSCLTRIRDERTTDRLLQRYLFLARSIVDYCPEKTFQEIQDILSVDDLWAALLRVVLRACERQLCMGDPDDQSTTDGILILGLSTFSILFVFPEKHSTRIPTYDWSVGHGCLGKLDMITLAARLTVPAVERADSLPITDEIGDILYFHGNTMFFMHEEEEYMRRDTVRRLVATGRRCIGPTLAALHKCKPRNEASRQAKADMIEAWEEYRLKLGISRSDKWTEQDEAESAVWGACALKTCLCSRRATHHHKMRVCKGCRRVLYCGPRCQALDWEEGGHKKDCLRWRKPLQA